MQCLLFREQIHSCPRFSWLLFQTSDFTCTALNVNEVKAVFQWCVFFTHVYVRVLNTRQWTSLRVLSTPYVYARKKKGIGWKTAFCFAYSHKVRPVTSWAFETSNLHVPFKLIYIFVMFYHCLFVCIRRISQKVLNGFSWKFVEAIRQGPIY